MKNVRVDTSYSTNLIDSKATFIRSAFSRLKHRRWSASTRIDARPLRNAGSLHACISKLKLNRVNCWKLHRYLRIIESAWKLAPVAVFPNDNYAKPSPVDFPLRFSFPVTFAHSYDRRAPWLISAATRGAAVIDHDYRLYRCIDTARRPCWIASNFQIIPRLMRRKYNWGLIKACGSTVKLNWRNGICNTVINTYGVSETGEFRYCILL